MSTSKYTEIRCAQREFFLCSYHCNENSLPLYKYLRCKSQSQSTIAKFLGLKCDDQFCSIISAMFVHQAINRTTKLRGPGAIDSKSLEFYNISSLISLVYPKLNTTIFE